MKMDTVLTYILPTIFIVLVAFWAVEHFADLRLALDSSVEQHNMQSFAERKVSESESLSFIGSGDLKAAISR
ncbi:hypothetical protein [Kocuria rosea]|uniref:hypothetical protein n=1 Tax=Kocuria rosea TaxID=1275 RepID=UPI00119EF498|nr:hypothetical protein [Kocuria rosea]